MDKKGEELKLTREKSESKIMVTLLWESQEILLIEYLSKLIITSGQYCANFLLRRVRQLAGLKATGFREIDQPFRLY